MCRCRMCRMFKLHQRTHHFAHHAYYTMPPSLPRCLLCCTSLGSRILQGIAMLCTRMLFSLEAFACIYTGDFLCEQTDATQLQERGLTGKNSCRCFQKVHPAHNSAHQYRAGNRAKPHQLRQLSSKRGRSHIASGSQALHIVYVLQPKELTGCPTRAT